MLIPDTGSAGRKTLLSLLLVPLGLTAWGSAQAATSYVRTDGGDATQCTGRADAAYSGSGTNQACAWKHPYFALSPSGTKRIAGGDTLIIGSGSYMMGAGAPGAGSCNANSCYMPPVPSGTSTTRTRIIGKPGATAPKLWGTGGVSRVLNLQGSSNVEINNLEVTDQSDCVIGHSNSTAACSGGAYARTGLYASDSNNVQLTDVNIHGLGHTGIQAGRLANWTLDRVKINANGKAGWDGNVGSDSSSSGAMVLRNVEIAWNGCGERWQTGTPWACWAQQTGGYGDGLGMYWTAGKWLIEDTFVHHNTQDGVDLIYLDGADSTNVTVRRSYFKSNAGNQLKVRGNATIENSVIVSDCAYFEGKYYMQADDNCRANGNTLVLVMTSNDQVTVRHNTISGEGGNLVGTTQGDSSSRVRIENNVLVGFKAYPYSDGRLTSLFYANNAPAPVTFAGNLVWNVKGAACPTGSICGQNPMLTNMTLDAFDAEPLAGSPAIDKVAVLSGMNNDFLRQARPSGVRNDIGAYEMQVGGSTTPPPTDSTCSRSAPTVSLSGPSTTVAAGTAVTYSMAVRNNDTSACSNTTFNLARTVPSGWTGTLSSSSLALAPGASGNASLQVTSATTATAGSFGIGVGVGSNVGSVHTHAASATYDVGSSSGGIGLTGSVGTSKTSYAAGETVYMSARVLNNGVAVSGASVRFAALKPNGVNTVVRKATTDSNGYARASFESGTGSSSIGTYRLTADATSGSSTATATSTFSVGGTSATEPVASGLTETVGTSKTSYAAGETVYMSARVLNNGVAVSGASVRFAALKPNGVNTIVRKATTDSNGYARASFASGTGSSSIGTYRLTADATSGSSTATATSTFSVGGTSATEPEPVTSGLTETVGTSKASYAAGETVYMSARVLNNGVAVSGANVRFAALKPNGINTVVLKATTDSNGYARASFVSGTGSSSIGTYRLTADATSGSSTATATSTFSVGGTSVSEPVASGFTQAVTTSKSVYAAGETVSMSSRVLNNGVAVSGASVRFAALKPNGVNIVVRKATTDSNGYARASFASGTGSSSIGTYRLTTEATSGSSTATTSTTFEVR